MRITTTFPAAKLALTIVGHHNGDELLQIKGKGNKPATLPLAVPVIRPVHDATSDRKKSRSCPTPTGRACHRPPPPLSATARPDDRDRSFGEPTQPQANVLHRRTDLRSAPAHHAVRPAIHRRRHHHAMRLGPSQPRPVRRPPRRRLSRRHGHGLITTIKRLSAVREVAAGLERDCSKNRADHDVHCLWVCQILVQTQRFPGSPA
jgi:hypothetical protein